MQVEFSSDCSAQFLFNFVQSCSPVTLHSKFDLWASKEYKQFISHFLLCFFHSLFLSFPSFLLYFSPYFCLGFLTSVLFHRFCLSFLFSYFASVSISLLYSFLYFFFSIQYPVSFLFYLFSKLNLRKVNTFAVRSVG